MGIRRRFIEGNQDLTFIFAQKGTGYKITVLDNQFEVEIGLDEVNDKAEAFYIKQLQLLIIDKLTKQTILTA